MSFSSGVDASLLRQREVTLLIIFEELLFLFEESVEEIERFTKFLRTYLFEDQRALRLMFVQEFEEFLVIQSSRAGSWRRQHASDVTHVLSMSHGGEAPHDLKIFLRNDVEAVIMFRVK